MKTVLTFDPQTKVLYFTCYDDQKNLQALLQCIPALRAGRSFGLIPSIEVFPQYSVYGTVTTLLDTILPMMSRPIFLELRVVLSFRYVSTVVEENNLELRAALNQHGFEEASRDGSLLTYERQLQSL